MPKSKLGPEFEAWLTRVTSKEKPKKAVIAYNIGLFEWAEGFGAHLIGATEFSEDDSDWACDEAFAPKERWCPIPAAGFDGWEDLLATVVKATKKFLATPAGKESFLGKAQMVTVGFDDGDLTRVK